MGQAIERNSRKKWIVISAAVVLIGGGATWLGWYAFRYPYALNVCEAVAWQGYTTNQLYPRGTHLTVEMENRRGRSLADAEVIVEHWTDDRGKNLLIDEVDASGGHFLRCYQVECNGHGSGAVAAPPVGQAESRRLWWRIQSPVDVSADAHSVRVQGRVLLREGRDLREMTVPDFELRSGQSFRIADQEFSVVETGTVSGHTYAIVRLRTSGSVRLADVSLLDESSREMARGEGWEKGKWGLAARRNVPTRVDTPEFRELEIETPYGLAKSTLLVKYWSNIRLVELPFDVTLPLERKRRNIDSMASPEVPVPPERWGSPGPADATELFQIVPVSAEICTGLSPAFKTRLLIRPRRPMIISSFDVKLTGCTDSRGNALLKVRPLRSAIFDYWSVYRWTTCGDRPPTTEPVIAFDTNHLPSAEADNVTYEGTLTIKIARSPKDVEISDFDLDGGKPLNIGPLECTFARQWRDLMKWELRGDIGLIRRFVIHAPDNAVLDEFSPRDPWCYFSDAFDVRFSVPEEKNQLATIRATYLSESEYYRFPFRVTVPVPRECTKTFPIPRETDDDAAGSSPDTSR